MLPDGTSLATGVLPPETVKSPLPRIELPLIVLILVPETNAACFPLNVFQSVEVSCPDCEVVAFCKVSVIAGVVVGLAIDHVKPLAATPDMDVIVPECPKLSISLTTDFLFVRHLSCATS